MTLMQSGIRSPRLRAIMSVIFSAILATSLGCQSWIKSKKEEEHERKARLMREKLADPDRPRLAGEIASPLGLHIRRYDAIGLISNLPGTGGMVNPSPQRDMMLNEMRRHDVLNPETIIDSPSTAVAEVRVYVNPCDTKSDRLDVLVECSDECNATDLREGFLMPTVLRDYQLLGGRNRAGDERTTASGEFVAIPASVGNQEKLNPLRGVVIGGGKLLKVPNLRIHIQREWQHVMVVGAIEKSINRRFFYQEGNRQQKVANGTSDFSIDLEVVPKYRFDPLHYMSTVLSLGFLEADEQVAERIEGCRRLLFRRETARRAACELEAIGKGKAIEVLLEGLTSTDTEVRFHSAYSLAYLDRMECVPVLRELAIAEPAFRPLCLIGLGVNEHPSAREALLDLLQESEPELRYGALLALRQRNPQDPMVLGESLGEICHVIRIPSNDPLTVVSLEQRKEIVLFGRNATITLHKEITPTPSLKIVPLAGGLIRIAKVQLEGEVLQSIISNDLESLVRAMPSVNANYNDVVHSLDQLGIGNALDSRVAINARPRPGRIYHRDGGEADSAEETLETVQIDNASRSQNKEKRSWVSVMSWPSLAPSKPSTPTPDANEQGSQP